MSFMNRLSPPEPDYTDDEWERAEQQLVDQFLDDGYSEHEAEVAVDDWLIAEQCDRNREDREAEWADQVIKRRKEDW